MDETKIELSGPDLAEGVDISQIADGVMLLGHASGEAVLLARRGDDLFAIGAICTHYGAPLIDGLLVGDTIRCPWHHACFSLHSGAPLRPPAFYREHGIELKLNAPVASLDTQSRHVLLADGTRHGYDKLLLATGAEPVRLDIPGSDLDHVHYLRTLADSRTLVEKALIAKRAVVIGASFIGLEVASSLRARNVDVHVVAPDTIPMEKILGADVGNFIRRLHEQHGVTFHLGTTAVSIDKQSVRLTNGESLQTDLVVIGIGVQPRVALAEHARLAVDRGVTVDEYLETSAPGIFAAGDIARWPDRLTGERIRVEHWVLAERQGQTAARNMLGAHERFDAVPFFWTEQYDFGLAYIGHAERWDQVEIDGLLNADTRNCTITYRRGGKKLAVAVVHRDLEGLRAEVELETASAATQ